MTLQENAAKTLQELQSNDDDVIRSAAFTAGDELLVDAIPFLSEHIKSRNIGVQEAAEYALRKIRGPKTIQKMLPHLQSEDSSLRNVAMDILREISCDDVAALQPLLRDHDPDIRIFMADIMGHSKSKLSVQPLCEALLKDPEVNVRYQAAMSLGNLAFPEAAEALHQAMHDEEWVQFSVVEALTKIGADSTINALVQSLNTCSPLVASVIIDALGELKNIKAVPFLLKFIEKAPEVLRHKTVKAIVQILGAESLCLISEKEQVKFRTYLEEALSDEDEDVLQIALVGLSAIGDANASKAIMELLKKIHREPESDVYQAAISALADIGYNDIFASYLCADDSVTVFLALTAALHTPDGQSAQKIQSIFWDLDRDSQRLAAQYLAEYIDASNASFMLEVLEKASDENVIKYAIACLGIRLHYEDAQEKIFHFLEHPYTDVKEVALEACIQLHTPALTEHFVQWLNEGDEEQRMMAVYALGAFGLTENFSAITRALEDESASVRQLAVEAFAQPDVSLHEHIDTILAKLNDESPEVRTSVVDVLAASNDLSVYPYLIGALDDNSEWVCIRAIEALSELQPNEDLATTLIERVKNATPMVTLKIIEILGKIGGEVVFKALIDIMQSDIAEVQQAATEALTKVKAG